MNNEDKMLQLVLSDESLIAFGKFNPDDFKTVNDALKSKNPVVITVARIIREVRQNANKNNHKEIYNELLQYLYANIR